MPSQRTGAQIIWECLVHEGVNTVFGYPGGAILPAYDAMLDYPVRHVLVRHEQGATHMADGDAREPPGIALLGDLVIAPAAAHDRDGLVGPPAAFPKGNAGGQELAFLLGADPEGR